MGMILFSIPSETLLTHDIERDAQVLEQREDDTRVFEGPDPGVEMESVADE
ncbi:MAG: hypothetical protein MZW92_04285 [Comamonadaceae bacterium]|nr:hypothetical protein [Comamonadaceae bacterium]